MAICLAAIIFTLTAAGYASFATIAGYAAVIVAAFVPAIGLAVLILHAPERDLTGFASLGFHFVLGMSILFGCLVRLRNEARRVRVDLLWAIFLAFGTLALIQVLATPGDLVGEERNFATEQLVGLAAGGALLLAAQHQLRTREWGLYLDCVILSTVVAVGLALASVATNGASQSAIPSLYGLGAETERAVGPFNNPNYFGLFVVTGLLVALYRISVGPPWRRILTTGAAILISVAVVVSFSRGALLAGAAGIITLAFSRSRFVGIATLLVSIVVVVLAYNAFYDARVAVTDPNVVNVQAIGGLQGSDQARLSSGTAGLRLFAIDPVFGIGFGRYHFVSPPYIGFNATPYSHDWYVNVLAEQGIVGISLVVAASVAVVARLRRAVPSRRGLALAVLAAYGVGCLFTESPTYLPTSSVAWLVVGGALASIAPVRSLAALRSRHVGPVSRWMATVAPGRQA